MTENEEVIAMLETLKEQAKKPFSIGLSTKKDTIIKDVSIDSLIFVIDKAIEGLKKESCYKITCCSDCEVYDKEKHNCPRFCEVIKNSVKEIKENV